MMQEHALDPMNDPENQALEVVAGDLDYIASSLHEELKLASGKQVLITGGAGFLGYYMVQALTAWNDANPNEKPINGVISDSFSRGKPEWLNELSSREELTILEHDITQPLVDEMTRADYIVHAASIASPIYYRENPIRVMDANVNGLRQLLDHMANRAKSDHSVSGLLFFSTSEIYGDPDEKNIPTSEDYRGSVSCTGPRACYDESKRYGETLCVNFANQVDLPITIVRPFNNYGPGLKITDRRAPPDIARDILSGGNVVLLSDGSPTRTFCYIADAVIGYYKVLFRGKPGRSYNIGNDSPEISIREFAQRNITSAQKLWGYTGELSFASSADADYLTDNPHRRCPNIDRAKQELAYSPSISLDDGIARSLVWYAGNNSAEES
jgi:nucleoside-diphosphate-sugar epimerase